MWRRSTRPQRELCTLSSAKPLVWLWIEFMESDMTRISSVIALCLLLMLHVVWCCCVPGCCSTILNLIWGVCNLQLSVALSCATISRAWMAPSVNQQAPMTSCACARWEQLATVVRQVGNNLVRIVHSPNNHNGLKLLAVRISWDRETWMSFNLTASSSMSEWENVVVELT